MNDTMTLTDGAAKKLAKLKAAENNDALMLRVYVTGGGCSGFSYGFDFAEEVEEDDATFKWRCDFGRRQPKLSILTRLNH